MVVDDAGREHRVLVDRVAPDTVEATICDSRAATGEPRRRIVLLIAVTRDTDAAVAAATWVGAAEVWPVVTERTVVRLHPDRVASRVQRWQVIAREAAGLAGRGAVPRVASVRDLEAALADLPGELQLVALTTDAAVPFIEVAATTGPAPLALVVGPEGGLGPFDRRLLEDRRAVTAHLGARVLPSHFAGAAATLLALAVSGDMSIPVCAWPEVAVGPRT